MFNMKWGVVAGGTAFVLALIFSLLFGKVLFFTALLRALIFAVTFFALGTGAWILISSFIPELLSAEARENTADIFTSEAPGSRVNITVGNTSGAALPDTGGMSGVDEVGDISDLISGKIKPAAMPSALPFEKDMDQIRPSGYNNSNKTGEDGLADVFSASDSGSGGFSPDFSAFTGGGGFADAPSSSGKDAGAGDSGVFGDFSAFTGGGAGGHAGDDSAGGPADDGKASVGAFGDLGGFTGKASASDGIFDDDDIFSSAGIYSSGGTFGSEAPPESDEPERRVSGNKAQEFEGDFNPKEIAMGLRTVLDKDKKG